MGPDAAGAGSGSGQGVCCWAEGAGGGPLFTLKAVSRFLDRLASGAPIVADGGMGMLVAAAAPPLRSTYRGGPAATGRLGKEIIACRGLLINTVSVVDRLT